MPKKKAPLPPRHLYVSPVGFEFWADLPAYISGRGWPTNGGIELHWELPARTV